MWPLGHSHMPQTPAGCPAKENWSYLSTLCILCAGFIFEQLAREPRFDNVMRRPGYSRGPSGFLPVAMDGMSLLIVLFMKEKGTFGFLGVLSSSPKSSTS